MTIKKTIPHANVGIVGNLKKSPYSKPVLQVFGSIKQLTQNGNGSGADGGAIGMSMVSDRNTKEKIVRIGEHPLGIGLYLFDYKLEYQAQSGYGRQFGVMADEVDAVMPEAVTIGSNGYKQVNYGMLGIQLGN